MSRLRWISVPTRKTSPSWFSVSFLISSVWNTGTFSSFGFGIGLI